MNETKPSLKDPAILIATWFGLGLLPRAPGTWGSLGALPFGVAIYWFAGPYGLIPAIVFITLLGLWAADKFDQAHGTEDSPMIVVDEVAGQWIALLGAGLNPVMIGLAFILFRLFDITKPYPCNRLEKIPGAWGVMTDDLMAGLYALICLVGLRYVGIT